MLCGAPTWGVCFGRPKCIKYAITWAFPFFFLWHVFCCFFGCLVWFDFVVIVGFFGHSGFRKFKVKTGSQTIMPELLYSEVDLTTSKLQYPWNQVDNFNIPKSLERLFTVFFSPSIYSVICFCLFSFQHAMKLKIKVLLWGERSARNVIIYLSY